VGGEWSKPAKADFTQQTKDNFGKINLKRGHRVIEFVVKYLF
jgi:hypothetical protein